MNQRIGIIIPTKNREKDILEAIKSSIKQEYKPSEIIIIDQSDNDKLRFSLDKFALHNPDIDFKYLYRPDINGLTAAKNVAIELTKSDILTFIDDDIVLDKHFIRIIYDIYNRLPEIDGVGGVAIIPSHKGSFLRRKVAIIFQLGPFRDIRALIQAGYFRNKEIVPTWLLSGGLSSLRRKVFESVLFNDELKGASPIEDMDFYLRSKGKFNFVMAVNAKALHNVSSVNRVSLRNLYKVKLKGFLYIYREYIKKSPLNILAFVWKIFGLILDAFIISVTTNSLEAVKGLSDAFKKY